jgi:hypothetical protein
LPLLAAEFGDLIHHYRKKSAESLMTTEGSSPRQRLGHSPFDVRVKELEHRRHVFGLVEGTNDFNGRFAHAGPDLLVRFAELKPFVYARLTCPIPVSSDSTRDIEVISPGIGDRGA